MHKKTILKGDVSMPKGDYQRKLRRIDYSKKEIADQLNCSENTVDSRIKQLCKDYGLPEGMFKRDGANGTNFFPPEYTPLLIELLKYNSDNPAMPRARKHENVMCEDVVEYNKNIMNSIRNNPEIPDYITEWIKTIPWGRTATDISSLLELLVTEIQVFIHNTLDQQGVDVGQALRTIIRNLDEVNYRMFQGNQFMRSAAKDQDMLKEENEQGLFLELSEMTKEEREACFIENPYVKAVYYSRLEKEQESKTVKLDSKELSIDQGLVAMISALMRMGDANQLKRGNKLVLEEFCDDENKYESVEQERKAYMENSQIAILEALRHDCTPGQLEFIISGKKWKCIADRIRDGEAIEPIYHQGGIEHFFEKYEGDYLKYFDEIKSEDSELKNIVSNFVGRLMVDFFYASNKK